MHTWHGEVVALSGDVAVLRGRTVLEDGSDAARVRLRRIDAEGSTKEVWHTGLATDAGRGLMAVIFETSGTLNVGDQLAVEIDVRTAAVKPPIGKSRKLFGIEPAELSPEKRRWLRQAILFALEARDPVLRADRLCALGV